MHTVISFKTITGIALFLSAFSVSSAELITIDEAKLPAQLDAAPTRGIVRGPALRVISPEMGSAINGQFDLHLKFEPRGGNRVDTDSLKVTYLKSPVVDLTARVKHAITENGLFLKDAEAPAGDHILKVSLKDISGRESSVMINLTVRK